MTARRPKVREYDQFILRLPGDMRDRIKAAALAGGRSMNAEIVARLEASGGLSDDGDRLGRIEAKIDALMATSAHGREASSDE